MTVLTKKRATYICWTEQERKKLCLIWFGPNDYKDFQMVVGICHFRRKKKNMHADTKPRFRIRKLQLHIWKTFTFEDVYSLDTSIPLDFIVYEWIITITRILWWTPEVFDHPILTILVYDTTSICPKYHVFRHTEPDIILLREKKNNSRIAQRVVSVALLSAESTPTVVLALQHNETFNRTLIGSVE